MERRKGVDAECFKVTDTSPPPTSSICYTDCGSQTMQTDCLVISSSGGKRGAPTACTTREVVVRVQSSTEVLDKVLWRSFSRSTPASAYRSTALAETSHLASVPEDAETIVELISNDQQKTLRENVEDYEGKGTKMVFLEKIKSFLIDCKDPNRAALIWFAGHGHLGTGDWVLSDGTIITFEEVLGLYENYLFNRILYIVCDCCYAGRWVTKLAEQLDEKGIGACGHEAKKVGYFLKVISSCREEEKARDGAYIKGRGVTTSAKDRSMQFYSNRFVQGTQITMVLDTTSMRCFRDPSTECLLHKITPRRQWKWVDLVDNQSVLYSQFQFVCSDTHWYAVLFDREACGKILEIFEKDLHRHGFIVATGNEFVPPEEEISRLCLYSPLNFDPGSKDMHVNTADCINLRVKFCSKYS